MMPGIENPNTATMNKVAYPEQITITPTLIPITPPLIASLHTTKYIYHIAPADVLNITVWQHTEFTSQDYHINSNNGLPSTHGAPGQEGFLVNPDGYIYFPLVGSIHVANKTVDQVRAELTNKLKKYIKNPELNVRVADFRGRKVYVLGEVLKPGFVPLNDQPLSITDAIVFSGGLDPNAADSSHIYVIRGNIYRPDIYWLNAKTPETLLLAEHFNLNPGDILFISSAPATRWNRVLNQLLPTVQTVWYTKAIVNN
jgi:polysaccharide export outer membrane protein